MQTRKNEIWVGVFLLLALLAALFMTNHVLQHHRGLGILDHATVFKDSRSKLRIFKAHVQCQILFAQQAGGADRKRDIEERYNHIPDTSSLSIRTSGLLGEQYLALNVGFEDPELGTTILKDGSVIHPVRPATNVRQYV